MIHENSLFSWAEGRRKDFGRRAMMILGWLQAHGRATDRQIATGLGFRERNSVSPRLTELIEKGAIREYGNARDEITGKTVRIVEVVK